MLHERLNWFPSSTKQPITILHSDILMSCLNQNFIMCYLSFYCFDSNLVFCRLIMLKYWFRLIRNSNILFYLTLALTNINKSFMARIWTCTCCISKHAIQTFSICAWLQRYKFAFYYTILSMAWQLNNLFSLLFSCIVHIALPPIGTFVVTFSLLLGNQIYFQLCLLTLLIVLYVLILLLMNLFVSAI